MIVRILLNLNFFPIRLDISNLKDRIKGDMQKLRNKDDEKYEDHSRHQHDHHNHHHHHHHPDRRIESKTNRKEEFKNRLKSSILGRKHENDDDDRSVRRKPKKFEFTKFKSII